jgi:hypothetical protein
MTYVVSANASLLFFGLRNMLCQNLEKQQFLGVRVFIYRNCFHFLYFWKKASLKGSILSFSPMGYLILLKSS